MDQTTLQNKIAEYFVKLPPDAQSAFSSMQWMESLKIIATKYNLSEPQIEVLGTETTLALLGIVHPDQYEQMLVQDLGLPKNTIDQMILEIDGGIMVKMRSKLESTYQANANALVEAKYGDIKSLDKKFEKLPEEVKQAIGESNYQQKLYDIGNKYKLTLDQIGKLEEVTTKVMLGLTHPETYSGELAIALGIQVDKINEIVNDVNEQVLKNIREILKSHWNTNAESINEMKVPLPPYAKIEIPKVSPPVNIPTSPVVQMPSAKLKSQFTTTPLPKSESGIFDTAGIEIMEEEKKPNVPQASNVTMNEDRIMVKSGISMIEEVPVVDKEHFLPNTATQKSVLAGIEHPVKVATNIINQKLGGQVVKATSVSDQSLPKVSVGGSHDLYREEV